MNALAMACQKDTVLQQPPSISGSCSVSASPFVCVYVGMCGYMCTVFTGGQRTHLWSQLCPSCRDYTQVIQFTRHAVYSLSHLDGSLPVSMSVRSVAEKLPLRGVILPCFLNIPFVSVLWFTHVLVWISLPVSFDNFFFEQRTLENLVPNTTQRGKNKFL